MAFGLNPYRDPKSMQDNCPKPLRTAQKALNLHIAGVQVMDLGQKTIGQINGFSALAVLNGTIFLDPLGQGGPSAPKSPLPRLRAR